MVNLLGHEFQGFDCTTGEVQSTGRLFWLYYIRSGGDLLYNDAHCHTNRYSCFLRTDFAGGGEEKEGEGFNLCSSEGDATRRGAALQDQCLLTLFQFNLF